MDRSFLTLRINAFHSVYLSVASQLNCGCLSAGPPSLGPCWPSDLWLCAPANVWIVTHVASATAFANHLIHYHLAFHFLIVALVCTSLQDFNFLGMCFFSLPLLRPTFHSWHHVIAVTPLYDDKCLDYVYCVFIDSANKCVVITSACIYILCKHYLPYDSNWPVTVSIGGHASYVISECSCYSLQIYCWWTKVYCVVLFKWVGPVTIAVVLCSIQSICGDVNFHPSYFKNKHIIVVLQFEITEYWSQCKDQFDLQNQIILQYPKMQLNVKYMK